MKACDDFNITNRTVSSNYVYCIMEQAFQSFVIVALGHCYGDCKSSFLQAKAAILFTLGATYCITSQYTHVYTIIIELQLCRLNT